MNPELGALVAAARYLVKRPRTLLTMARGALGLEVVVPLDLLRWLITRRVEDGKIVADVQVSGGAAAPAVQLAGTVNAMGARLRVQGAVTIDEVAFGVNELRLVIRIGDLRLDALDGERNVVGQFLRSGAVDTRQPASLLAFTSRPRILVAADGDRFTLDLLRLPALDSHARLRSALAALAPVVSIDGVRAENDLLLVRFVAHRGVLSNALALLAAALTDSFTPSGEQIAQPEGGR